MFFSFILIMYLRKTLHYVAQMSLHMHTDAVWVTLKVKWFGCVSCPELVTYFSVCAAQVQCSDCALLHFSFLWRGCRCVLLPLTNNVQHYGKLQWNMVIESRQQYSFVCLLIWKKNSWKDCDCGDAFRLLNFFRSIFYPIIFFPHH